MDEKGHITANESDTDKKPYGLGAKMQLRVPKKGRKEAKKKNKEEEKRRRGRFVQASGGRKKRGWKWKT